MTEHFNPTLDLSHNRAPIYVQLSTLFRRFIVAGQWRVDARIPTHEDLAVQFDVNPATIRKAIAMLEDEGLVRRYRRHGTFVVAKPISTAGCRIGTNWADALQAHEGLLFEQLEARDVSKIAEPFHSGTCAAQGYRFQRRLYRRGREAVMLEESHLDQKLRRKIGDARLAKAPILILLDGLPGFRIDRAEETIRFGIADAEISTILKIPLNASVAIIHQSVYGRDGVLHYESRAYMRGDLARISEPIKFPERGS